VLGIGLVVGIGISLFRRSRKSRTDPHFYSQDCSDDRRRHRADALDVPATFSITPSNVSERIALKNASIRSMLARAAAMIIGPDNVLNLN